jgi:dTDP-4-amino-4,6-dideoxygalactose transaminase
MDEAEAAAAARPILSGWITQGPEVAAFEKEFAQAVGAPYACAVGNCTAALHLALLGVGVTAGDEVITASHSYIATANSIRYVGGLPVFVDVDAATFNLVPSQVEAAIGPLTRAILCIHQIGMPCDLEALAAISHRHGVPLVEDAACAAGSEILWDGRWERIGRPHGDVACFSFHPRKVLSTGDGGMLTTRDGALDARFRRWRQHSISVPDTVRHASGQVIFESYSEIGYNYRMTDIQAAVGREQLKRLPLAVARRRALAARYRELLTSVPSAIPPLEPAIARSNWQSYCVRLPETADQKTVMQSMLDAGVATRRAVMCSHREPAYQATGSWKCWNAACEIRDGRCSSLAESERAQEQAIMLPLFHQLTEEEQQEVVRVLGEAIAASGTRSGAPAEGRPHPSHQRPVLSTVGV